MVCRSLQSGLLIAAAALAAAIEPAPAQKLVANINTSRLNVGNGSSNPSHLTQTGSAVLFAADDGVHGVELWRTEGRPNTTRLLKDIRVRDSSFPASFTPAGARTWFVAEDDAYGRELWVTDGTPAGTRLVADIVPGISNSSPGDLASFGSRLFFVADDGVHGREPWVSDGTAAGTRLLRDINPGAATSSVLMPTALGGRVYFFANDGTAGSELWRTDGTAAGTQMVVDLEPGGATVPTLPPVADEVAGVLYFAALTSAVGVELWRTDGTAAGTRLVDDLTPGPGSTRFFGATTAGGVLYFSAHDELWRSDGTAVGTSVVVPRTAGGPRTPLRLTAVGARVLFFAFDSADLEPWVSDGTVAGTFRLADTTPGSIDVTGLAVDGAQVFFANRSVFGTLWLTDLTVAGTRVVSGLPPPGVVAACPRGGVVFVARDARGVELWTSDGTAAGTGLLADIVPPAQDEGSAPNELVSLGSFAVFSADDGVHGRELWRTDGTLGGTAMIVDAWPGARGSTPSDLVALRGRALFTASVPGSLYRELWATDGSTAGSVRVLAGTASISSITAVGAGRAVFRFADVAGEEPWITDGTPAGTHRVADLTPGPGNTYFTHAVRVDETRFALVSFVPDGPSTLWWSDGTAAGTRAVMTFAGSFLGANGHLLRGGGGRLFFRFDAQRFVHLWVSDGTPAGTVLLHADAQSFLVDDAAVWIVDSARVLWKGDGTRGGMRRGPTFSVTGPGPTELTPFSTWDGDVLLAERGSSLGQSMWWQSDGTAAGTRLLATVRDEVVVTARLGARRGLVMTRQRASSPALTLASIDRQGTMAVLAQLRPSLHSRLPFSTLVNGRVLFMHDDGALGDELWSLDPGAVAAPVAAGCAGPGRSAQLRCDDPSLGQALTVVGEGIPLSATVAALWLGRPSVPLPRIGACALAGTPELLVGVFQVAGGSWARIVPVPATPRLLGVALTLQATWGPTDAPLGFDLSDGVLLTFGR